VVGTDVPVTPGLAAVPKRVDPCCEPWIRLIEDEDGERWIDEGREGIEGGSASGYEGDGDDDSEWDLKGENVEDNGRLLSP
jgi:hypothetical protein